MKKERGITLVALIATVIVMLILLTVTVTVSVKKGGLVDTSREAADSTRALEVDKAKELWLMEKEEDEDDGVEAKSLKELLTELQDQELLTKEEAQTIVATGTITIAGRTITFSRDE